ncbi:unnamed protein product [Blepharisma stoltei]|uniref:Uncharacterized protein n=1 Tax=Blepharisma stoltei TaxID=1481888 RepID=A0AAU9JAX8_9CILI|nr:unnamed protein product [Blepharisma stoltei]
MNFNPDLSEFPQNLPNNSSVPAFSYPEDIWLNWPAIASIGISPNLCEINDNAKSKESPSTKNNNNVKKKRGRKPLRPFDPIKKKTEEKDKYWLRSFRSYMKFHYPQIENSLTEEDKEFWLFYLGSKGKPDKGGKFLSYGKKYKDFLFSHQNFIKEYRQWFAECGQAELNKKCEVGSDLWFVYYDYASKELLNYTVEEKKESIEPNQGFEDEKGDVPVLNMEQLMNLYMMSVWMQVNS